MTSCSYKKTQLRLAELVDETLYPCGAVWTEIANYVRNHPNKTYYTLDELEGLIGASGFSVLTAVFRLSMPPYALFETTVEVFETDNSTTKLSVKEYQQCILNGGVQSDNGGFINIQEISERATIHLRVLKPYNIN